MTRLRNRLIVFVWQRERDSRSLCFFLCLAGERRSGEGVCPMTAVMATRKGAGEYCGASGRGASGRGPSGCGRRGSADDGAVFFGWERENGWWATGAGGEGTAMTCDNPQRWRHYIARRVWIRRRGHPKCCAGGGDELLWCGGRGALGVDRWSALGLGKEHASVAVAWLVSSHVAAGTQSGSRSRAVAKTCPQLRRRWCTKHVRHPCRGCLTCEWVSQPARPGVISSWMFRRSCAPPRR